MTAERFIYFFFLDARIGRGIRHLAPWIFGRMEEICQILMTNFEAFIQLLFNSELISESCLKRVERTFVSKFCDSPAQNWLSCLGKKSFGCQSMPHGI